MVHKLEGSAVERGNSWESNSMVRMVSYADIVIRNIHPNYLIDAHNLKNI